MLEESVWDYPRPPRLEPFTKHIRVMHADVILLDSAVNFRILETSHPPTYYIPMDKLTPVYFEENNFKTYCEFKGTASYLDLKINNTTIRNVGWFYKSPNKTFAAIKNHVSLYASKLEKCYVSDELVQAQEGDFYGGWITNNIKGPFKGGPDTYGW